MNTTSPNAEEFRQILREEAGKISSPRQIAFFNSILIEPYQTRLVWEYGKDEEFVERGAPILRVCASALQGQGKFLLLDIPSKAAVFQRESATSRSLAQFRQLRWWGPYTPTRWNLQLNPFNPGSLVGSNPARTAVLQ